MLNTTHEEKPDISESVRVASDIVHEKKVKMSRYRMIACQVTNTHVKQMARPISSKTKIEA